MCGICGFIENGRQNDRIQDENARKAAMPRERILSMMMAALIHRGPDQGKGWMSESAALGFRRLSIIDPDGSVQPMANEDGDKRLVFNGEIYNFQELRLQLLKAGHRFSTQGDSEVLLHGYEEWGEKLPEHLRGMFAFAIWDEKEQTLFAARDPFGIKPFYYTVSDDGFIFASEIKGILPHPSYRKKMNPEALEQYLSFQYSVLENTFFQGIRQLLPGHFLTYKKGDTSLSPKRYFLPELIPEPSAGQKTAKEWVDRLDQVVSESVKAHMIADVEVGTFLSGGVDSSLIASEFTGSKTFTVGFGSEDGHYNEIPLARELAETLELESRSKRISEKEFWEAVPEVLYHMDEPSGDPSAGGGLRRGRGRTVRRLLHLLRAQRAASVPEAAGTSAQENRPDGLPDAEDERAQLPDPGQHDAGRALYRKRQPFLRPGAQKSAEMQDPRPVPSGTSGRGL